MEGCEECLAGTEGTLIKCRAAKVHETGVKALEGFTWIWVRLTLKTFRLITPWLTNHSTLVPKLLRPCRCTARLLWQWSSPGKDRLDEKAGAVAVPGQYVARRLAWPHSRSGKANIGPGTAHD